MINQNVELSQQGFGLPNQDLKKFFLGANAPGGFFSCFDQLGNCKQGWQSFLIKGGPGTGKSSLMKSIAGEFRASCKDIELIFCSSDPDSLDGVICHDKKFLIVDATAPHTLEPNFPGAFEKTISMCDCWNECVLQDDRNQIADLFEKNSFHLVQARNLFLAAYGLLKNNFDIVQSHVDQNNLESYFCELVGSEFDFENCHQIHLPQIHLARANLEQIRFLSTISHKGPVFFQDTITQIAKKIYVIEDEFGPVSSFVLERLRTMLLNQKVSFITCYCSILSPNFVSQSFGLGAKVNNQIQHKIDHILVPDLQIAFVTSNRHHNFVQERFKTIDSNDFVKFINPSLEDQLKLNKKQIGTILKQAESFLQKAKTTHDKLERCYFKAMDFNLVNLKVQETIKKIKDFLKS